MSQLLTCLLTLLNPPLFLLLSIKNNIHSQGTCSLPWCLNQHYLMKIRCCDIYFRISFTCSTGLTDVNNKLMNSKLIVWRKSMQYRSMVLLKINSYKLFMRGEKKVMANVYKYLSVTFPWLHVLCEYTFCSIRFKTQLIFSVGVFGSGGEFDS